MEPLCKKDDGELVKVLMIAVHCCIRVIKESRALKKLGYKLDLLTNRISYGTDEFERIFFYHDKQQLMNILKDEKIREQYQIFHVHNEPDWPVVAAHEAGCKNIIFDCHDLDSVRIRNANLDEIRTMRLASGIVFVSEPVQKFAKELYDFKQPSVVLHHFCNEGIVEYTPEDDLVRKGIVYEGGANPPNTPTMFKYRSLHPIMKKIVEMGNELYMFIGNGDGFETYQDIGAVVYPPTHYDEMMKEMVKMKWGACMFNNEDLTEPQTNLTTMNKAYEYIAAGLPVLFLGAPHQAELFKPYNISIELKKIEDLGNVEQNFGHLYPELKSNVDKMRKELVMENNIHIVEELYNAVRCS